MKRIGIFANNAEKALEIKEKLYLRLDAVIVDDINPDIVIFIGGDGTLLRAIERYLPRLNDIVFVGVHAGTLGFFCDYSFADIEQLLSAIIDQKITTHPYHLLEANVISSAGKKTIYAVNEIRLENPFHTLISDVYVNGLQLETFHGNGLVVASTLGSSAYNKSLGGALIVPALETMQLTEIATIQNNAYRSLGSSLVVDQHATITFKGEFKKEVLGYDHLMLKDVGTMSEIRVSLSRKVLNLAHFNNNTYIATIRKAFL